MNEKKIMPVKQTARVLAFMHKHGRITQRDAFKIGIYRLSARIFDLRQQGYRIKCETRTVRRQTGTTANIAVYSLVKKNG